MNEVFNIIAMAIIYIIMIVMVIAGTVNICKPESEFGKQWVEGFSLVAPMFMSCAGMFAAVPFIEQFSVWAFSGLFNAIGADPALAPCLLIATDNGAYQLAADMAATPETWMFANIVAYLSGPIAVFIIPVGFSIIQAKDKKYLGLGIMCGLIAIPFAVFISMILMKVANVSIRPTVSATAPSDLPLNITMDMIWHNMIPLVVFCFALALLLYFFTDITVKVFTFIGNGITFAARIICVLAVFEYFTGFFSGVIGHWGFAPIVADEENQLRSLEVAGYIGMMLAGAYPLIWLIRTYLAKPLDKFGKMMGISGAGVVGFLTCLCESLITFTMLKDIHPVDKVKVVAFSVCGAWILGGHISFTVSTQPNILMPLLIGKLCGGIIGLLIAYVIGVPTAKRYMQKEIEEGIIAKDEYTSPYQMLPKEMKALEQQQEAEEK